MTTIGLLDGMGWESTALYSHLINEETRRLGGELHSAPLAMVSVDFEEIKAYQQRVDWAAAVDVLAGKRQVEAVAQTLT